MLREEDEEGEEGHPVCPLCLPQMTSCGAEEAEPGGPEPGGPEPPQSV